MTVARYQSTRGLAGTKTFDEAIFEGLAEDGGLYLPVDIPDHAALLTSRFDSVSDLASSLLPAWTGLDPSAKLFTDALGLPIPLVHLGKRNSKYDGIHVAELFHGPTESFKDFGARFLAGTVDQTLKDRREKAIVLVATSGDTGSAVADAFADREALRVVVLYPKGRVSTYQERQLTIERTGVFPIAVRGTFDDCQQLVKQTVADPPPIDVRLTTANSINVGRLLPQILFYVWSALAIGVENPVFVVPSGNLGNLTAGLLAGRSVLRQATFVAATNENDFFCRYLHDQTADHRPVRRTFSNAMDVGRPSNLERIQTLFSHERLRTVVDCCRVSETETRSTLAQTYTDTGYVPDPHTSTGLFSAAEVRRAGMDRSIIVLATAAPRKYASEISSLIGIEGPKEDPGERAAGREIEPDRSVLCDQLLVIGRDFVS